MLRMAEMTWVRRWSRWDISQAPRVYLEVGDDDGDDDDGDGDGDGGDDEDDDDNGDDDDNLGGTHSNWWHIFIGRVVRKHYLRLFGSSTRVYQVYCTQSCGENLL